MNIAYRQDVANALRDGDDYRHIEVLPLTGTIGAELRGVDLSTRLDDEVVAEIRRALLENLVIFFRDQALTPVGLRTLGRRFGELHVHEFVKGLPECPEIIEILKTEEERVNFGGTWHSDVTYHETPPLGSILHALEVPEHGGDTLFANMYLAYETLSEGLREMLEGRTAVHGAAPIYGARGSFAERYGEAAGTAIRPNEDELGEIEHPIFRTHPETGRKGLYVNGNFTIRLSGLTEAESAPILQRLYAHATTPDLCCRFRWRPGSVAFWDNRCAQHYAVNDYPGQRRRMLRVTVLGDRPY